MRKRPRKRRPKRSSPTSAGQQGQRLSRKVRELYRSQGDPDAEDWHAGLDDEPTAPRRPGRRRGDPAPAARAARRGIVVALSSGTCRVATEGHGESTPDDEEIHCILPSELARDQRSRIAIGDEVAVADHGRGAWRIDSVLPRRTTLSRPDPHNPRQERVIAANIDVAVHVASVVSPPLSPPLIDRYLIAIERGGAEPALCVNKIDLLNDGEARRSELTRLEPYRRLGLSILPCSAATGEGIDALRALLAGRTAVFVGHSGVGKSSLLNALSPGLDAATGRLDDTDGKGRHTTSRSSLHRLAGGTRIIDTPGIREFGLWRLTPRQVREGFPELSEPAAGCRFSDCSHTHEPDCAVLPAVDDGRIPAARYEAYLRILASLDNETP